MREITFLTGNAGKFAHASAALTGIVHLVQHDIDVPEIQSMDVAEIARFSARYGSRTLDRDVIVTDVGYYIEALNGFPGPFIKFVNQTLTSRDIQALMRDHPDHRTVDIHECLAYCPQAGEPRLFIATQRAWLVAEPAGNGSAIDNMLRLDGFAVTVGCLTQDVVARHWQRHLRHYQAFADYIGRV